MNWLLDALADRLANRYTSIDMIGTQRRQRERERKTETETERLKQISRQKERKLSTIFFSIYSSHE